MRKWCEKCGELEAMANPFPWIPGGEARAHRAGCPGGRVIHIATICEPPEPTVIEASDLAPGMLATIRSEFSGFTCIGQAALLYVGSDGGVCGPTSWLFDDDENVDEVVRREAAYKGVV